MSKGYSRRLNDGVEITDLQVVEEVKKYLRPQDMLNPDKVICAAINIYNLMMSNDEECLAELEGKKFRFMK